MSTLIYRKKKKKKGGGGGEIHGGLFSSYRIQAGSCWLDVSMIKWAP